MLRHGQHSAEQAAKEPQEAMDSGDEAMDLGDASWVPKEFLGISRC